MSDLLSKTEWTKRRLSLPPRLPPFDEVRAECVVVSRIVNKRRDDPETLWRATLMLCDVHDRAGSNCQSARAWKTAGELAEMIGFACESRRWLALHREAVAEIDRMEQPENNPYIQEWRREYRAIVETLPADLQERIRRYAIAISDDNCSIHRAKRLRRKFRLAVARQGVVLPGSASLRNLSTAFEQ